MTSDIPAESLIQTLVEAVGANHVLAGDDCAPYATDWTGGYVGDPLAVVRPGSTGEVAACMRAAAKAGVAVIPAGGLTGLTGATKAERALMISTERLNKVRDIRTEARVAVVEAGVILQELHDAVAPHGLSFPMTFGARGSARLGGLLSTNAGGSNVLRYGNTRALCLGLEVVLASGEVLDLMGALHKDNSGYDLKHLFIGAEGTLGMITAAVLKLVPTPTARSTAFVGTRDLDAALTLLNRLQMETGGAVEAYEFMAQPHLDGVLELDPATKAPFQDWPPVTILLEVGATAPRDTQPGPDGTLPLTANLIDVLGTLMEEGAVLDAVVAQSEAQRDEMWRWRELAAEVAYARTPMTNNDVALPLDAVPAFIERAIARVREIDADARFPIVAHLGDGNVHFPIQHGATGKEASDAMMEAVEDVVMDLGGSFSAEHGIGVSKLGSMGRRKNPVALSTMRAIKAALDPQGMMNPGKVLPD